MTIDLEQYKCSHCGKLPPDFYDEPVYNFLQLKYGLVVDEFGYVPPISSGYRCPDHPLSTHLSVHMFGLAIDTDLPNVEETRRFARCVDEVYPSFRMGVYDTDGKSFVHVDIGFYIKPRSSEKWREGARW